MMNSFNPTPIPRGNAELVESLEYVDLVWGMPEDGGPILFARHSGDDAVDRIVHGRAFKRCFLIASLEDERRLIAACGLFGHTVDHLDN